MLNNDEYTDWWIEYLTIGKDVVTDPAIHTLAAHVRALWDRLEKLIEPEEHDINHGSDCRCYLTRCCCAYDHPLMVCDFHKQIGAKPFDPEA